MINHLRNLIAMLLTIAAMAMIPGCSAPPTDPIIIGVLLDMPTPGGLPSRNAAMLAASEINAAGGILSGKHQKNSEFKNRSGKPDRRRIELLFEDTENTPAGAIAAMRRLTAVKNLVAVVGPNVSRNAIAVANIAENNQIPLITPGSTHPDTTLNKHFVFRASYTDPQQGYLLSEFSTKHLGSKTAAVLFDISRPSSRSVAETFKEGFETQDGLITNFESYVTGVNSFETLVAKTLAAQPGVLLLPNPSRDTLAQAKIVAHLSPQTILLGTDSWSASALNSQAAMQGAYYTHHWHPSSATLNNQNKNFITSFQNEYGNTPATMAALTYDAFNVLFSALERGGTDSNTLRDALMATEFTRGLTGSIAFGKTGDPQKDPVVLTIANKKSLITTWNRGESKEDISNQNDPGGLP